MNEILPILVKGKKFFANFSVRSAANIISKILNLIALPIITRALGPEAYGKYNLINIVIHYTALPISLLGLRSYGIREIAAKRKSHSYANHILSMQFSVAIFAVLFSVIICYIIFQSQWLIFLGILFGYLNVFASSFDLEFFYVSQKDLVFPSITGIIGQLLYLIGVILFIKKPDDFPILVFLSSITPTVSNVIQIIRYSKKNFPFRIKFSIKESFKTLKNTYQLGISQNLEGLIPTIPQILIPIMVGTYALGIFSGGYKIYTLMQLFYVTFFFTLVPYLVQLNDYKKSVKKRYHFFIFILVFSAGTLLGLILFFFGEPIVLLILGKGFGESVTVFKIISLTLIPLTPVAMLLGNILIYSNKEKYYLYGLAGGGLVTIFTSYFLIKNFNEIGAVLILILSLLTTILILGFFYFRLEWKS